MKIEALFSKSYTTFFKTIKLVAPLIVVFTVLQLIFSSANLDIEQILLDFSEAASFSMLISVILGLIYNVIITQYIFDYYHGVNKLQFNINKIFIYASKIIGLYIISVIPCLIMLLLFSSINYLGLLLPVYMFLFIYVALFFSQYFIICYNARLKESIINSYTLIRNNYLYVIVIIALNMCLVFFSIYFITIIVSILSLFSGEQNLIIYFLSSLLANVGFYFISIFNISFFKQFEAIHNIK